MYCDSVKNVIDKVDSKVENDNRARAWTRDRLYFLDKRVAEYIVDIKALSILLRTKSEG